MVSEEKKQGMLDRFSIGGRVTGSVDGGGGGDEVLGGDIGDWIELGGGIGGWILGRNCIETIYDLGHYKRNRQ